MHRRQGSVHPSSVAAHRRRQGRLCLGVPPFGWPGAPPACG
jgi:hypothetical protein